MKICTPLYAFDKNFFLGNAFHTLRTSSSKAVKVTFTLSILDKSKRLIKNITFFVVRRTFLGFFFIKIISVLFEIFKKNYFFLKDYNISLYFVWLSKDFQFKYIDK